MTELDFDALFALARAQLPAVCPEWTDHNPSDPGIALLELAAAFIEMQLFQAGRPTDEARLAYMRLLDGPARALAPGEDLEGALDRAVRRLREPYRAVTVGDYAALIRDVWPSDPAALSLGPAARVARVLVLPSRDLEGQAPTADAPGHLSVAVVGAGGQPAGPALLAGLAAFLDPRRMLTVRVHVVAPTLRKLGVAAALYLEAGASAAAVLAAAQAELAALFDPASYPFGQTIYVSEVAARLDGVEGVEFVEAAGLVADDPARRVLDDGAVIGVRPLPHELLTLDPAQTTLALFSRAGGQWTPSNP